MLCALIAKIVRAVRSPIQQRLRSLFFGIQQAQRVDLQAAPVDLVQLAFMRAEVFHQRSPVGRTALWAADRVELEIEAPVAQPAQQSPGHRHQLDIQRRIELADRFHIELVMLPVASRLRGFVPEDRADRKELHRLGQDLHAMFDISAHNAGCEFRPQRHLLPVLVLESIHFFVHDVGARADSAREQVRFF